jgi:hypothetical protein
VLGSDDAEAFVGGVVASSVALGACCLGPGLSRHVVEMRSFEKLMQNVLDAQTGLGTHRGPSRSYGIK